MIIGLIYLIWAISVWVIDKLWTSVTEFIDNNMDDIGRSVDRISEWLINWMILAIGRMIINIVIKIYLGMIRLTWIWLYYSVMIILVPIKMVGTLVMTTAIILYETTRQNIILPGLPGEGGQPERDAAIGNARNNPELGVNNAPPRVPPPQPQPPRNPRQQRVPVEKIVVETVTEEFDLETFITPGGDTVTTRLPVRTKRKTTTTRF